MIIAAGLTLLAILLGRIVGSILAAEATGWIGHLSRVLVNRATEALPANQRKRWNEEWEADLLQFRDRPLTQLAHASSILWSARALSRELTSRTHPRPWRVRALGVAARAPLPMIDLSGLVIGIYAALLLNELYSGTGHLDWGGLWRSETDWLPLFSPLILLAFLLGGLYRSYHLRGVIRRVVSSLGVVAFVALTAGFGTGQPVSTLALLPTAFLFSAATITQLRWSYEFVTTEVALLARDLRPRTNPTN